MIELHHCFGARSFRPLWTLEEMGLNYRLHLLPFPPRFASPGYKDINPLGTVPLFVDGDLRMTESSAISHYIARRYGPSPLAVEPDDTEYGAFLNWTHFGEATLTFPQTLVLRYRHFENAERQNAQVADDYARWFLARLRAVESVLQDRDHLCAGRFTVADISVGYALKLAGVIGLNSEFGPRVQAYWSGLQERDGYSRARAAEEHAAAVLGPLDPFGRMVEDAS
ncbi:glutathione S-transferase family protein [Tianweitania sediminis]|uniref:Glutathione S-transferase family protein n=1 Tax=Tianweitania sediminis TaxID=1502156 RepID=A0A8J7R852_9HYPH|nr:glutathione S-transferase family protein [Tianweitania sediminis]MBP0439947.1 glutathione S-transferase family protein [Tianweitania sediminis]